MSLRCSFVVSLSVLATTVTLLAGCSAPGEGGGSSTTSSVGEASTRSELKIEDNNGSHTVAVPFQRVAVTDNRSFELLADWNVPIVAAPLNLVPKTLADKLNDSTVEENLGSHREPDLEALVAAEPDVVINGQRFDQYQDDIVKLVGEDVAVLDFEPRDDQDFFSELVRQTEALGQLFGHEEEASQLVADFNKAVDRAKAAYDPSKKVMAVNTSGGEIGYIAPGEGRVFGPVFDKLGLTSSLDVANGTDNHQGDDISVESIAKSQPDWIFIMDRDGAIGASAGTLHGESLVKDNAALQNVTAVKEGHIVVAPEDTYTNENIITYTEIFNQIADAFEAANQK